MKPMLAVPMSKATLERWSDWAIEEKYDGHRLIVHVMGFDEHWVEAFTRPRKRAGSDGKTMAKRELPIHLQRQFSQLPTGIYDGELMARLTNGKHGTSTDVTRVELQSSLEFVVFDLLHLLEVETYPLPYDERRALLEEMFRIIDLQHISLAKSWRITTREHVNEIVDEIWDRGGEGVILKRRAAPYQPGKRSKDMVKIKEGGCDEVTLVGFEPSRGEIIDRGPFGTCVMRDDDGNEFTVKTPDDETLAYFEKRWTLHGGAPLSTITPALSKMHPDCGRRVFVEYNGRASNGARRHPRWDRWENE